MAIYQMNMEEFLLHWQQGGLVVDVREPEEHLTGIVPGAYLLPLGTVQAKAHALPQTARLAIICRSGQRSNQAASHLNRLGFDAVNVQGGMLAWTGPLHFPQISDLSQSMARD